MHIFTDIFTQLQTGANLTWTNKSNTRFGSPDSLCDNWQKYHTHTHNDVEILSNALWHYLAQCKQQTYKSHTIIFTYNSCPQIKWNMNDKWLNDIIWSLSKNSWKKININIHLWREINFNKKYIILKNLIQNSSIYFEKHKKFHSEYLPKWEDRSKETVMCILRCEHIIHRIKW